MPRIQPIQQSFSAGEVSPFLHTRSDLEIYQSACVKMENFACLAHGPAGRRAGLGYIATIPGAYGRIFPFTISTNIGYIITVTGTKVYINDQGGFIIQDDLVRNPDFISLGADWTELTVGSGNVTYDPGICHLQPGVSAPHYAGIRQNIDPATPATDYTLVILIASGAGEIDVKVGTTSSGTEVFSGTFDTTENIIVPLGTGHTTLWIDVIAQGSQPFKILDRVSVVETGDTGIVEFTSPWTESTDIRNIHFAMPPGGNVMYMVSGTIAPQKLEYNIATGIWTFGPVVYVSPPPEWGAGNYPGAITFHQGRQWLGGSPNQPESFWGSVSGIYEDFTPGDLADDALYFSMSKKGAIRWMQSIRDLVIGTDNGEHIVSAEDGIIIPGDINVIQHTAYGSNRTQAVVIDNRIIHVTSDLKEVREMGYSWTDDGWTSKSLSFASEHIAAGLIIEIAQTLGDFDIMYMVDLVGDVIGCTYKRDQNIIGWHKHTTQGKMLSVCAMQLAGVIHIWVLTDRDESGTNMYLEQHNPDAHMDSYVFQTFITPTTILNPIPHLADKQVQVVVDGAVHPDITLDGSGQGELQYPGTNVYIGLQYISYLTPMPVDKGAQMGSSKGMMKRWNKIWVHILASAKPVIEMGRPPVRHPSTPMGEAEPLRTENVLVANLGWDREAQVHIMQELPYPTIITGIFGEMDQENI